MTETLGDYEKQRALNIERNNARLRALGLLSAEDETTWKPKKQKSSSTSSTKRRRRPSESSRKSRRLQGLQAEHGALVDVDDDTPSKERHQARQQAALEYYEGNASAAKAALENRTATYEHCLMRVQSMTHAGLAKRIKVMERAAGKHCVVKMAIFVKCLQDEGLNELAATAGEALERLKALQPPPLPEEE